MFKDSLFTIKHQRAFDRSLTLETIDTGDTVSALLFSANHSLLSTYNISNKKDFFQMVTPPYSHKLPYPPAGGHAVYTRGEEPGYDVFIRSQGGSLCVAPLAFDEVEPLDIRTDPSVWALEVDAYFGDGLDSLREHTLRDLTRSWDAIASAERSSQPKRTLSDRGIRFDAGLYAEVDNEPGWTYDIPTSLRAPKPTGVYNDDACESLNSDLEGSYTIFANKHPGRANTGGLVQELTRAASAMGIHPVAPEPHHFSIMPQQDIFTAANALLSEWNLGSDPAAYRYRDPYDSDSEDEQPLLPDPTPSQVPVKQRRPPVVASTKEPPALLSQQLVQSQASQPSQSSQSQPFMQTQVAPGKFGARPAPSKKKKKRVGGF